ncbi:MAG: inner rane protein OxaA [Nitrospirae bacterium]|nr:inner rane protein OxaA [Nitrospirota bacterium]
MEKRALIALALSFGILLIYQFLFVKPEPQKVAQQPKAVGQEQTVSPLPESSPDTPSPAVGVQKQNMPSEEKKVRVETALYSAVFSSKGAALQFYELNKYRDYNGKNVVLLSNSGAVAPLGIGAGEGLELSEVNFHITGQDLKLDSTHPSGALVFTYSDAGVSVRRTYTFSHNTYRVDIKDEVSGLPDYWITLGSDFGLHDRKDTSSHIGPVILKETDRIEFNQSQLNEPKTYTQGLKWIAQEDKYFFASLVPVTPMEEAKIWKQKDAVVAAFKGKSGNNSFILYAGPKEYDALKALNVGLEHIVDFGFFSIIALPLFWVLKFFYQVIGNYGWAIIVLTILVRIPFIPLVNKSQKSMKKMQDIQPRMAEVREKYKKDPQKMQQEMMQLYKTHKVNPLGGCLPILLQIPVFFALYKILLIAIELRQAPFMLWIKDLSAPDTLFGHLPLAIPLIGGFAIGPLPILMGATMVIQQKMTPTSLDPTQNKMMMLMPVVFTFLFLNFASGLVLYWLMNNIFSIAQQFYVNQKLAKEKEAAKAS